MVEHVLVVELQLREVEVLFDRLVLRTELLQAAYGVYSAAEDGWCEAMGRLLGCCRGRMGLGRRRFSVSYLFVARIVLELDVRAKETSEDMHVAKRNVHERCIV